MPSYVLQFTLTDTYSTGTDELTWEVRTAASGGGSLLATDVASSGVPVTTGTINDSGLAHGSNSRWLRVIDGAGNILDQEFTVTAQLIFDKNADGDAAIDVTGDVSIGVELSGDAAVDVTGNATVEVIESKDAAGDAAIDVTGDLSLETAFESEAGIDLTGDASVTATLDAAGDAAIDVTGDAAIGVIPDGTVAVEATGTASVGPVLDADAAIDATGDVSIDAETPASGDAAIDATGDVSVEADLALSGTAAIGATGDVSITLLGFEIEGQRLRVDVLGADGELVGPGPLSAVLHADYTEVLDGIGDFSLTVAASDPAADSLTAGREIRLYREGEGLLFRGIVSKRETLVGVGGDWELSVTGVSLSEQLRWANTLLGREYSNEPMGDVVDDLLSGTGWTANDVESDSRNVTAQFEGVSIWAALVHVSEMFGWHVRERNLERAVDVGKLGDDTGLILRNVGHIEPDTGVIPITRLQINEIQDELWNRVIPLGGGEGISALTLEYSDRSSPYTIQSDTGPDGQTYWYLEDATSVAAHGARTKVLVAKDIIPLANSESEFVNAANTLYDVAAAWLAWHSEVHESYQVGITGLKHMDNGTPLLRVGDTVRLHFRGVAERDGTAQVIRSIDEDVWVLAFTRSFNADGSDTWQLTVGTNDRLPDDDAAVVAKALEDLWALQTAKRPYVYREIHGPYVESVDSSHTARLLVDFDSDVSTMRKSVLRLRKRRVKSNVSSAAGGGGMTVPSGTPQTALSGGAPTSESGGSHSHSITAQVTPSGGGHTSQAGSAHTHSVTGGTISFSGGHNHLWGLSQPTSTWADPAFRQQIQTEGGLGTFGFYVGRDNSQGTTNPLYTTGFSDHNHTISGLANASESSHTHGILNHTHTISAHATATVVAHQHNIPAHTHAISSHTHELPEHTHALVYGIYLGPTASSPQFTVTINGTDRTSALGGPWNGDFEVDITQYLVNGQGHVLRQTNNIDIGSSQLCDVEVVVRSLVTATSVVPV